MFIAIGVLYTMTALLYFQSGHQPCVRVYEHEDHNWVPVAEFSGHKFGINVVVSDAI